MRPLIARTILLSLLLVGLWPHALSANNERPDLPARVAELRELLGSEQGAAILDLLGDPDVRQAILQDPAPDTPGTFERATAGEMMDDMLTAVRARFARLAAEIAGIPEELDALQARMEVLLPGPQLARLVGCILVFLAGGIGAQRLFYHSAKRWRGHFGALALSTPRQRARAAAERLVFGTLMIAAFAAGSMGAFLLFTWPPATGSLILGYLLAFLMVRLSMTATRFFLAPGAERLRLVHVDTRPPGSGTAGQRG